MKLFTACPVCNRRIDIATSARVRAQLPLYYEVDCPHQDCAARGHRVTCSSRTTFAEAGAAGTVGVGASGAALGGLVAGPIGLGIGLLLGLIVGANADGTPADVQRFNAS